MECSKCHKSIKEGQEVCLSCGHILGYESEVSKKCRHCNRKIPINYRKCPFCKKKQVYKRPFFIMIFILLVAFLNIYFFISLYGDNITLKNNYKNDCTEISYTEMVKKNEYYDEAYIKFSGTVKSVRSINKFANKIEIEIIMDNNPARIVKVKYFNVNKIGFIKGDSITVYGKYKHLSGNTPIINSRIIEENA